MSAKYFTVDTYAFPDPASLNRDLNNKDFKDVNEDAKSQVAFSQPKVDQIRSLSAYTNNLGTEVTGLLYSPSIPSYCNTSAYVPYNASHVQLPRTQLRWMAIAPWINTNCTLTYLDAVRQRDDPITAFIFYRPDDPPGLPPSVDDAVWNLNDYGAWKRQYPFAVFAIPSDKGNAIMQNLAAYSGNISTVPNSSQFADRYGSNYYVRTVMNVKLSGGLPSLWVFLLIVLGILMLIIASTSCVMHILQRRRRSSLRRRIVNGQVDLETLGIKRLTVPKDVLDKMPVYIYAGNANNRESTADSDILTGKEGATSHLAAVESRTYLQPTCAICLEDYVGGESTVRELPCKHIFHPECIDVFLKENSSLCPMCKKSALPKGYCPTVITNAMVRRERIVRQVRARNAAAQGEGGRQHGVRGVMARMGMNGRRVFNRPIRTTGSGGEQAYTATPSSPTAVEMRTTPAAATATGDITDEPQQQSTTIRSSPPPAITTTSNTLTSTTPPLRSPLQTDPCIPPPTPEPTPAVPTIASARRDSRREWARQRALAMVGQPRRGSVAEEVEEVERRRPAWRRGVGRVWPGLA